MSVVTICIWFVGKMQHINLFIAATLLIVLSLSRCGEAFTTWPTNFLSNTPRLFGVGMARVFDNAYADNRLLEMRNNLRVPTQRYGVTSKNNYRTLPYRAPYDSTWTRRNRRQQAEMPRVRRRFEIRASTTTTTTNAPPLLVAHQQSEPIHFVWPPNSALDRIERRWQAVDAAASNDKKPTIFAPRIVNIRSLSDSFDAGDRRQERNQKQLSASPLAYTARGSSSPYFRQKTAINRQKRPLIPGNSLLHDSGVMLGRTALMLTDLFFNTLTQNNYGS